ncbi:hypothetical protein CYY_006272 [Polysphondylium violaceum]|uniref:Alpha-N-acetylglucosaminidase n=1 Tax=Polysphondylium violaceum TaxID=133409 RepID=A0A8J4PQS9_9MYCE|nr:hypothetical protein CYY_006272 [Polysphondylium violaceum]
MNGVKQPSNSAANKNPEWNNLLLHVKETQELYRTMNDIYEDTVYGMISRLLGNQISNFFKLEIDTTSHSGEYFTLQTDTVSIMENITFVRVTANSGVNLAMGVQHYLKYYCKCSFTWTGDQCNILPQLLPQVDGTIVMPISATYRYYMNVCTFGYSTTWWNFTRWEREIDWMALNGYNTPLAFVGQEYIWYYVFEELGLNQTDIMEWFTGPAFLPWNRMGNVNQWGGPVSMDWINGQKELQQTILKQMRSFGMRPVLPGFAGHVPPALAKVFPHANITQVGGWGPFAGSFLLDPSDPLYKSITKLFINLQTATYGTDHLYNFDPFNELDPPSNSVTYLYDTSSNMYKHLLEADPKAVWVLQGWCFVDAPSFWKLDQTKAFLSGVPVGGFLILDLWSDVIPAWNATQNYFGHYWIWCMLHNFGGRTGIYGRMPFISTNPIEAKKASPNMVGIGLTPEAIEQTSVVYDLMSEMSWRTEPVNLTQWMTDWSERRYGKIVPELVEVWVSLSSTVYNANEPQARSNMGAPFSFVAFRPGLNFRNNVWYDLEIIYKAWSLFSSVSDPYVLSTETFSFDVSEITIQALSNYFLEEYYELEKAYNNSDSQGIQRVAMNMLSAINQMDEIASSQEVSLVGKWTMNARSWASVNTGSSSGSDVENDTLSYEFNARNQLTLWGPNHSSLHDYAYKLWGGLIKDFYYVRWATFTKYLLNCVENQVPYNSTEITDQIIEVELEWGLGTNIYPFEPSGSTFNISKQIQSTIKIPDSSDSSYYYYDDDVVVDYYPINNQ